jgi:hypothetical protein
VVIVSIIGGTILAVIQQAMIPNSPTSTLIVSVDELGRVRNPRAIEGAAASWRPGARIELTGEPGPLIVVEAQLTAHGVAEASIDRHYPNTRQVPADAVVMRTTQAEGASTANK